jgi:hypothetical protein
LVDSCQDPGRGKSAICEEEKSVTTRFYDIEISAIDAAGNVGTATCSVIVDPDNHYMFEVTSMSKGSKKSSKSRKGNDRKLADSSSSRRALGGKGSKRGKGSSKSKISEVIVERKPHDVDDLRAEYALSTQRYVVQEASLLWDAEKNTELAVPNLPKLKFDRTSQDSKGGSKGKGKGKGSSSSDEEIQLMLCKRPVTCPEENDRNRRTQSQRKKGGNIGKSGKGFRKRKLKSFSWGQSKKNGIRSVYIGAAPPYWP